MQVVVGTHPIPKKYLDMLSALETWTAAAWKPLIAPSLSDAATRARYD